MGNHQNIPFVPGQGGRLATSRLDFQDHLEGINPPGFTDFRHTADQIDVLNPSLVIDNSPTVEIALENLSSSINTLIAEGGGYITIGDGYNAWVNANGSTNLDPNIPTLDTFLNPLFASIYPPPTGTYSALPPAYARLQFGGVILIKAGTYMVANTINVPPGITLLGEGFGTKIVNVSAITLGTPAIPIAANPIANATNTTPIQIQVDNPTTLVTGQTVIINDVLGNTAANNTASNPYWTITVINSTNFTLNNSAGNGAYTLGSGTMYVTRPIFNILPDVNRVSGGFEDDKAVSGGSNPFMFARQTVLTNMVIADNFVEPTTLGDSYYTQPQNFTNSSFTAPALITQQQGSNLVVDNVVGVGRVQFSSGTVVTKATTAFINTASPSLASGAVLGTYLRVNNCLIDGFSQPFQFSGLGGSLDFFTMTNSKVHAYGYLGGDSTDASANTFINTTDANMVVNGNNFYGNANNMTSAVFITPFTSGGPPAYQAKSKVTASGNDVIVNRAGTTGNQLFNFYYPNPSYLSSIYSYVKIQGRPLVITASASPYPVDTLSYCPPYTEVLLVNSSTGAIEIDLPDAAMDGVTVTISDIGGEASTNPISIVPYGSAEINGITGALSYRSNYGSITLTSSSNNWWSV